MKIGVRRGFTENVLRRFSKKSFCKCNKFRPNQFKRLIERD